MALGASAGRITAGPRKRTIWVVPMTMFLVAKLIAANELTESRMSSMVSEKNAISKPRSSACCITSAISLTLVNLPYPKA